MESLKQAVPLSCQLCRRRKIKCDKNVPCSNCVTAQKECIPVVRARLPRGRNGGRKGINAELRNRINRLEGLVHSLNSGNNLQAEPLTSPSQASTVQAQQIPDSNQATPDVTQWPMGSTLWTQLAQELNGIHTVLDIENDDDNDNDEDADSSPLSATLDPSGATPLGLLSSSSSTIAPIVSDKDAVEYLKIFRRNVDYILKFVHIPSFERLLTAKEPYLGHAAESITTRALVASAFYACICSISNSHCLITFDKTKEVLRSEWQQTTFQCLAKVEIMRTPSLVSLQALALYIASLRSHQNDQQSWMLVSLAVRMAQSLQLHREESYSTLPWGQAELRRRIWYTLQALDYQAAMDRGSDLGITPDGYTTKPPADHVDSDYALDSSAPSPAAGPCIGMIFYSIHCKSNWLLRRLNWVQPGEAERSPTPMQSSWKVRQDAIAELERSLEIDILSHIQQDSVLRFACISFTKVLLRSAQMYAVRPLQRHPAMTLPPPEQLNVLLIALEAVQVKRSLLSEPTEPWHWLIKGFVDWHGLAVLLAELCNPDQYDPQLVERAWTVALLAFDTLSEQIAEGVQGPLWKPMKKLMRSAQKKRQDRGSFSASTTTATITNNTDVALGFQGHLSAYTTSAMDMLALDPLTGPPENGWTDTSELDPLQASWFNWQSFTDDLAMSNGYGWGAMDFDPIFGGL